MSENLLEVKNLKTYFYLEDGVVPAVDGVDFTMAKGEILGIVGESGCGKSMTSLSILQLLAENCKIVEGEILFEGEDLCKKSKADMYRLRGNKISMIFQEPMTSLNPIFRIGTQISEVYKIHQGMSSKEAREQAAKMLKIVGIPSPERRMKDFPHQLSGGMRQRVMIAMALACSPSLLIADEPTTALDVTIQAQILQQMKELKEQFQMSILLITHDMGVVAEMSDRIMVMYAGQVIESGTKHDIFKRTKHPYTQGLLASIPLLTDDVNVRLETIEGTVPSLLHMPSGCPFHPRCRECKEICKRKRPPVTEENRHTVKCFKYTEWWNE